MTSWSYILDAKYIENKRWFIVMKLSMMSFDHMSWGVLQICDLENDGMNCSIVIKVASVHIVHGLQALWIGLVQHLSDAVWTRCWSHVVTRHCSPFAVDYTRLFSTTTVNHCKCTIVRFLSVTEECHGEQCQFTAKGHNWAVWYSMLSAVVVTFIHHKGRPRWISRLEAYACKSGSNVVAYC